MYIPTTFFSSQGACVVASTNTISGSGLITSGTFASGSVLYQYYQFENTADLTSVSSSFSASLNILSGSTGQAKILVVAGGGAGGYSRGVACPTSFAETGAGGGGGGGVVYYNQFPISSGSYEIVIGAGGGNPAAPPRKGLNSYIKLPNNFIYPPFANQFITANGGGSGAYVSNPCSPPTKTVVAATTGGSGGGAARPLSFAQQTGASSNGDGFGGLNNANQGNKGGDCLNSPEGFQFNVQGAGGGGSSTSGSNTNFTPSSNTLTSNGGDGLQFNLTGTSLTYAAGGGGATVSGFPDVVRSGSNGSGTSGFGNGGRGNITNKNVGTLATSGVVIIAFPICLADSDNCKTYTISGGATGGTMTYIPCDTQTITTTTIDFGYTGSACLYNVAGYPTTTGTVTLTQVGTCNTFIPIAPTVTCTPPLVKTPVNVYNYSLPGQCYPTPSSCQRLFYPTQTINYVDVNAVSQSVQVGGWFTGTGQICARSQPTPTITGGTLTNSGLICGYYCSGSI